MPYCPNCGAQTLEGARFCASCGKALATVAAPVPQASQAPGAGQQVTIAGTSMNTAQWLVLGAVALYVVGGLLVMMAGNMVGLVVSALIIAVIYVAAYMPLSQGKYEAGRNGIVIAALFALVLVFIDAIMGDPFAALWNVAAAALLGVAWLQIKG
jgi:hypothetical protein